MDGSGGGRFDTAEVLADAILETWGNNPRDRYVVFTGGEPLLQIDADLMAAVRAHGFAVAIETNGTLLPPVRPDWFASVPRLGSSSSWSKATS